MRYSLEPRKRKYLQGYGSLSFAGKIGNKYGETLMDSLTKTGIDCRKNCF